MSDTHTRHLRPLSPQEAAAALGVSRDTVYRWLRTGRLRGWQAEGGGHWLVPRREVARIQGAGPVPVDGPDLH